MALDSVVDGANALMLDQADSNKHLKDAIDVSVFTSQQLSKFIRRCESGAHLSMHLYLPLSISKMSGLMTTRFLQN